MYSFQNVSPFHEELLNFMRIEIGRLTICSSGNIYLSIEKPALSV